jgi:hypothetical protein
LIKDDGARAELGIWLERPVQVQGQNNVTEKAIFWAQASEPSATA